MSVRKNLQTKRKGKHAKGVEEVQISKMILWLWANSFTDETL